MTTIKVRFQPAPLPAKEGCIVYQITCKRKSRQVYPGYQVFKHEWDEKSERLAVPAENARKRLLISIQQQIHLDMKRLSAIIGRLDDSFTDYSADDIVAEFRRYSEEYSLRSFMKSTISRLSEDGKIRTSEAYLSALSSFSSFLQDMKAEGRIHSDNLTLDRLDTAMMESYEAWQKKRGNTRNTISFYTRILRAVYNRAVKEGAIQDAKPFHTVYTGIDKTIQRALSLAQIKKLRNLNLTDTPELDYARDMFILCFMLRGMSFIDMAFLRKSDLSDSRITYRRRKTGQLLNIGWTVEMQEILEKYPANNTLYLLPIIKEGETDERHAYKKVACNINYNLKRIAKMAGINLPLTLYVARHSWASAARDKGIPIGVISEGLGHNSEKTTKIYLSRLDITMVDEANRMIISCI